MKKEFDTIQVHVAAEHPETGRMLYLLLKRSADIDVYPSLWQVITGRIEPGESALNAAIRELKEESGFAAEKIWCLPFVTSFFDPYQDMIKFAPVFGVISEFSEPELSEEHSDFAWLSYDSAYERLLLPSHREGTQCFRENVILRKNRDMFRIKL
ncbi:MAG: NUDIX domain-containing protein [Candidatus Kapaibacterium sp.]